jgi:hypothetical protein
LLNIQDTKISQQAKLLNKALIDWQGDQEQVDDILVIGLQILS